MRLRLIGSAVLVSAALIFGGAALPMGDGQASHHPGGMDAMTIDMAVAGNTNADLGTVQTCARINENNLVDADEEDILAVSRNAAGATATTLTDSSGGWLIDQWAGNRVVVTAGTGVGQTRLIDSNTANTLTITQAWNTIPDGSSSYQIRLNDAVRVDTTAQGIAAVNNQGTPGDPSDDAGGAIAFSFDLAYPAGVTIASQSAAGAGVAILTRNAGSSVLDASESSPESDGLFAASALDMGSGAPESGSGVLSRLVLQSSPSAVTAVHALGLADNVHVDASGAGYSPDATNDNAFIAINTVCPPPDVDGDGWSDGSEAVIGTDPLDNCPDNAADNAWPADLNNSRFADITDISMLTGAFGTSVPPAPARYDIAPEAPDGFADITDITRLTAVFGQGCAP